MSSREWQAPSIQWPGRIETLIQTQREMLGHISHELRSPLTRMAVSLELLRRGEEESLEQMQADLNRLNQRIGGDPRADAHGPAARTSSCSGTD